MISLIFDEQRAQLRAQALNLLNRSDVEGLNILIEELNDLKFDLPANFKLSRGLRHACEKGYFKVVQYLIEQHNVPVELEPKDGSQSVVNLAISNQHLELAKYLIPLSENPKSDKPVCWEIGRSDDTENLDFIKYLVETAKIDLSTTEDDPLVLAVMKGRFELVKYLIEFGATPDLNAVSAAIESGLYDIFEYLLSFGFDIHADNESILTAVAAEGNFKAVNYLIEKHGCDIYSTQSDFLFWCAEYGQLSFIKQLIEHGFKISPDILEVVEENNVPEIVEYFKSLEK